MTKLSSASLTQPSAPPSRPSVSGQNISVRLSPGSKVAPVMPRPTSCGGAAPSKLHSVSLPSSFFTFTYSHECGLLKAQRATVPVSTTCVSRSNMLKE
jgi:hypothetical protein